MARLRVSSYENQQVSGEATCTFLFQDRRGATALVWWRPWCLIGFPYPMCFKMCTGKEAPPKRRFTFSWETPITQVYRSHRNVLPYKLPNVFSGHATQYTTGNQCLTHFDFSGHLIYVYMTTSCQICFYRNVCYRINFVPDLLHTERTQGPPRYMTNSGQFACFLQI